MRITRLTCILLTTITMPTHAIPWPTVTEMRILECNSTVENGPCSGQIVRAVSQILERGAVQTQLSYPGRVVGAAIHCGSGNALTGVPFSDCSWRHRVGKCENALTVSWEGLRLRDCNIGSSKYEHTGAGPGGECALWGVVQKSGLLETPYGVYDATDTANSGSANCIKSTPPDLRCEIGMLDNLDFGTVSKVGTYRKQVETNIDCGDHPVVSVSGPAKIELAPGVRVSLKASIVKDGMVTVDGELDVGDLTPGLATATSIIVVSPY